jgi:hypothetical protein
MTSLYAPLDVSIRTPRVTLLGATDELLLRLLPIVHNGVVGPDERPFDDPMSLYAESPSENVGGFVTSGMGVRRLALNFGACTLL